MSSKQFLECGEGMEWLRRVSWTAKSWGWRSWRPSARPRPPPAPAVQGGVDQVQAAGARTEWLRQRALAGEAVRKRCPASFSKSLKVPAAGAPSLRHPALEKVYKNNARTSDNVQGPRCRQAAPPSRGDSRSGWQYSAT